MNTKNLVRASILAAVSFALMVLNFPIGFPLMKLDLSDIPALIGAFALGPVWGIAIELIKNIIHWMFMSNTGGVGELANFLVGTAYVFTASLIYKLAKTRMGAIWGMLCGMVAMVAVACVANYFILIPFYINVQKIPFKKIIEMINNPLVKDLYSYVLYIVIPFNLIKAVTISLVTVLIYKHLSPILHDKRKRV